jgi:hypothetical protein
MRRPSTRRQEGRVQVLLTGLNRKLEQLKAYDEKNWNALSPDQQRELAELQQQVDKLVLLLARRGAADPQEYVPRRLAILKALEDKGFLRRAHLEAGVLRPITKDELRLYYEIADRRRRGESLSAIRRALGFKGSRQAFEKRWRSLRAQLFPLERGVVIQVQHMGAHRRIHVTPLPRRLPGRHRPPRTSK